MLKTFKEVRESFWEAHPEFQSEYRKTWRQNKYNATIRSAFVEYIDMLSKDGIITKNLKNRVTL